MPGLREESARRVLVLVGATLLLLLVLADLTRRDSLLVGMWSRLHDPETPAERVIEGLRGGPVLRRVR